MKIKLLTVPFFLSVLILAGCNNGPGEGGTSTIKGHVTMREYNAVFTVLRGEHDAQKEDVYLIYGDEEIYSDDFETDYQGNYEFKYLREGKYTIFVYSKDSTLNYDITDERKAVFREVEITGKNQVIEVPDIVILR